MNIPLGMLPAVWLWPSWLLCLLLVMVAIRRAEWGMLILRSELQHVFLGSLIGLTLLWGLSFDVSPGLSIHYFGLTALTLMFGWELALLGGVLAMAFKGLLMGGSLTMLPLNALLYVALPVLVSWGLHRLVSTRLPHNFFIYIFLGAFLGGMLAMLSAMVGTSVLLLLAGFYDLPHLLESYLIYVPLVVFPEGFLNGLLMTALVVVRPQWVTTFDDESYIEGQ